VADDARVPSFKDESADQDWRTHLYNQERMIEQQRDLLDLQKRLIDAMEKVASPERVRGVEEGQKKMVEAVQGLSKQMDLAQEQLQLAVGKLGSAFWSLMKVPVATIVVGVASWAFLYEGKISERTWLIMLGVAVFPWLSDGIFAVASILGMKVNQGNGGKKIQEK
jgi:hypothetical protein